MSSPTSKLFRPYQFKQMALTTLAVLPMAFHIVSVVFIGYTPEHACSIPMQLNRTNVDNSSTNDFTNATAEVCSIQWQHREDGQMINEETDCLYGVNYSVSKMHTFIAEWDLVCDRDSVGRISQSLVLGGMFLGALAAPLADKYGRKPVHVTFNIGLLIVTFTMAFVKSVPAFLVLRFFVGTFQQGMLITVVTFWLELLHLDSRENVGIVNAFMWASSVNVLTLVAFVLRNYNWRILQLALSMFSLFSIVEIFLMDESLRWLQANNKTKKCRALLEKIRSQNKQTPGTDVISDQNDSMPMFGEMVVNSSPPHNTQPESESGHCSLLVTDRILRRHSLITWGLWIANNLTYYGIVMMTPSLAGGRYFSFFLGSVSEMVGNFVLLVLIKKFSRKTTVISLQAVGSVSLLLTSITNQVNVKS